MIPPPPARRAGHGLAALLRALLPVLLLAFSLPALGQTPPAPAPVTRADAPVAQAVPTETAEVRLFLKPERVEVAPGSVVPIAVIFDHADEWHVHTQAPKPPPGVNAGDLTPTTIVAKPPAGVVALAVQWPKTKSVMVDLEGNGKPTAYEVFAGRAIAFLPVRIPADAPDGSTIEIPISVDFQACNDRLCLAPDGATATVTLRVSRGAASTRSTDPDFATFNPAAATATSAPASAEAPSTVVPFDFFGFKFNIDSGSSIGLVLLLLVALVGGLILNLTPCVLPVIPIKILSLSAAGGSRSRTFVLGLVTSAGVVFFWLVAGLIAAVFKIAAGELFGIWWFTLVVGFFIFAMGVGMLGLFSVNLPQWVYNVDAKHESPRGAFVFGIMTAVLSLPCVAPFGGTAMAWAATQPVAMILLVFSAIGVGNALPYLVLSAYPKLVNKVPRTGPASELVKQVMGLLMLAVAAFFIGSGLVGLVAEYPYLGRKLHWWIAAIFGIVAGVWLIRRTFQITRSPVKRGVFAIVGVALAAGATSLALSFTNLERKLYLADQEARAELLAKGPAAGASGLLWTEYSPAAFDAARSAGRVVVLDFTAEWCLTCKALKLTVLSRDEVEAALRREGVTSMLADLTSRKAPGWDKLKALGRRGIPLLAVFSPDSPEPVFISEAYTPDQLIRAIDGALGKRAASAEVVPQPGR